PRELLSRPGARMETPELIAFREKFRIAELRIADTTHWTWSVRPAQPTLGATVLSLRRGAVAFSGVGPEEMADLAAAVALVERATRAAFGYDKINYLMLMMVDPHVHFHVLPRHAKPPRFGDREWPDAAWPGPPSLAAESCSAALLASIRDALARGAS